MHEHIWCVLKHVFQTDQGGYILISEREYQAFLTDDELVEYEKDFAEIEAFEAPLFAQGVFQFIEHIYEDLTLPDGPFNGIPTGYRLKFVTDSAEKPYHLMHPNYVKWNEKMKADPRMHAFREPFWVE